MDGPVKINKQRKHLALSSNFRLIVLDRDPYLSLTPKTEIVLELYHLLAGIDINVADPVITITVNDIQINNPAYFTLART
jgi:hypothetical protein